MIEQPTAPVRQLDRASLIVNFLTFPLRALLIQQKDRGLMTSLRTERLHYAAQQVRGRTLDLGCGPNNLFIRDWLSGDGSGVDVYPYEGLGSEHLVDMTALPFEDGSFDSVTLIASINHIPAAQRGPQLAEAHRVLRPGGNIVVTQPNPIAGYLVHKLVHVYSHRLGTHGSMDHERGMEEDEDLYLRDREIRRLLSTAGFVDPHKHYFWSQWGFNHLISADKRQAPHVNPSLPTHGSSLSR